jgi:hypothetical protein
VLRKNTYYFDLSMKNPDPLWDREFYDFLEKPPVSSEKKHIRKLEDALSNLPAKPTKDNAFLRTCDLSTAELLEESYFSKNERLVALQTVLTVYIQKRDKRTKTDPLSLQAYNDAQTAKRRSASGENKVVKLSCLPVATDLTDLEGKIAKIGKSRGRLSWSLIKETFKINTRVNKEDKVPDCIFKLKKQIYLVEAKHVRRRGGAQNGSISELIALINLSGNPNLHFISFLDGSYPKYLSKVSPKAKGNKLEKQKYEISVALEANPQNYFVGTMGLKALFKDLAK